MKKSLFLFALLLNVIWASAQYSGSGNGTESDPYLIYNETQLYQMNNFLGSSNAGVVFKLMKDLDLTEFISDNFPSEGWMPIGVEATPFQGKFYGNSHKISGLWINRPSTNNVGLFGSINGATIQDLTIESNYIKGSAHVGTLVGYANGSQITNCHVLGSSSETVTGSYVGGVAGYILGSTTMTDCSFEGVCVKSPASDSYAGGFVGYAASSTLNNCDATTNVSAKSLTGGICGKAIAVAFTGCDAKGNIESTNNTGGICGNIGETSSCNNCRYEGDIVAETNVGGVVGNLLSGSSVTFTNSHSKGKITNSGDYTGGVVGISNGGCIAGMESCSHFGDISGKNYIGGLVGAITGSIEARPVYYGSSSSTTNDKKWGPSTSTVEKGDITSHLVNNCTSIGNILGETNVGGLIGSDQVSVTYSAPLDYKSSDGSGTIGTSYYRYLWRNNKCVVSSNTWKYYSPVDKENTVYTTFSNSYYSGIINGTSNVGGIAGYKESGVVQYCYTQSSIYGSVNVGGIVGQTCGFKTTTQNWYLVLKSNVAINNTISATVSDIGRIYGKKSNEYVTIGALASAEGNRALTTTKVIKQGVVQEVTDNLQNGNVMGQSLLKLKANYVALGWDFDNNWDILETECFPFKKYQAAPPVIESKLVSQDTEISGSSTNGGTVYLYYKGREAVSTICSGHAWTFSTEKLQSGAPVQLYADVDGMTPSYLTSATVSYPGSGTEADPYLIYTAEDLQGASNKGYYKLTNDIDLTSWINENSPTEGWVSIGRNSGEATYINGDGHKVTGLWINTTQDYTGLFSNFSAGIIKNLTVEIASGKKVKGGDYTGILIGRNANGQLLNCTVKGDVEGTTHVGGVTGFSGNNTINAVTYEGKVKSSTGSAYVGGFAGVSENDVITAVHSYSEVSAEGDNSYVGGSIGYLNGGSITKSHAENTLTATGANNYVGGLVGYSKGNVSLSYSTGTVTASGNDSYTGGLVGYAYNPIANCYSTAKTTGTYYTAGLCAYTYSTIDKCYAKGDVYGSRYGGGVVAQLDGSNAALTNSIAANNKLELTDQSAWGSRVIGGFRNGAAEPNSSNYALSTMQVSLNGVAQKKTDDAVEGIAKSSALLMSANTYIDLGWDYTTEWSIEEGKDYPYLLWEYEVIPVADITLDKTSIVIAVGNSETITASVLPLAANNARLSWTSSNKSVATVENGVVIATGVGTATITATSTDGGNVSATCKITVVENHDAAIAELQAIVAEAESLYEKSTEGENIGQYQSGARAALLEVIKDVKSKINSTMDNETITACTNEINKALADFNSKLVKAGSDTDLYAYDNILYIEGAKASTNSQLTLSLKMNNIIAMTGFQCDVYLPEGVTVVTDEDDYYLIELSTERTTAKRTNSFDSALQPDGSVRILAGSTKSATFDGTEGEVATITVNIDANLADGEYPMILKNVVMSDADGKVYKVEYVKTTLEISSYTIGDPNNDGEVNIGDFTAIANYILGHPGTPFVEMAADVNIDGEINVGDLTSEANLILYGSSTAQAKPRYAADGEATIYIDDVTMTAGEEIDLSVKMKNDVPMTGFQFDVVMPEGLSIVTDEDGYYFIDLSTERTTTRNTNTFDSALQADGSVRVLAGSTKSKTFEGTDGEVCTITVKAAEGIANGTYTVVLKNIIMSDATGKTYKVDRSEATVTIGSATGITAVGAKALNGKFLKNGHLIILKNNKKYDVEGNSLK